MIFIALLVASTLTHAAPLMFAGMGSVVSENSGVVNIGIEGQMTIGAFVCATVTYFTHNPYLGLLACVAAGALFGLLHGLACLRYKADQTISGIALNLIAPGLSVFLCKMLVDGSTNTRNLPLSDKLPRLFGSLLGMNNIPYYMINHEISVYLAFLTIAIVWFVMYRTRFGLRVLAIGEHPKAAGTLGVRVIGLRYVTCSLSGALAAIGGGIIPLTVDSRFTPSIISGQGFIAIAAVIFGKFKPHITMLACLLFGLCKGLASMAGSSQYNLNIPVEMLSLFPYVITLLVLLLTGKSHIPAASGKVYE